MKGTIFKKLGISITNLTMKKLPKLDEFGTEMTEMGKSHGKGTSFFLALPPREWGQNLVKHSCLSTGQRALPCNHRLLYSVHNCTSFQSVL